VERVLGVENGELGMDERNDHTTPLTLHPPLTLPHTHYQGKRQEYEITKEKGGIVGGRMWVG